MALIFLVVLVAFTISSFDFYQVKLPWLHCQWSVDSVTPVHWIIRFVGNAGVLSQAATEANNSRVKDALQLIWSAVPQKAIDNINAIEDYRKRLQTCVWILLYSILNT